MNNKGLTLVELITTFALTAVIVVLLINVIMVIKNLYTKTNLKTELYINQGNLSNVLNEKINSDNVDSYTPCTDSEFCYVFNFVDGESIKLVASENKIKFGDYTYNLNKKTKVVNPTLERMSINNNDENNDNHFLVLRIPIITELYPDIDFGINLVYPYDSNKTSL